MITCKDIIEDTFMPFLQHEIKIICSGKTIRHGKLLLVCMRSHYICFTITNNYNEPKSYEIPYPFDITVDHDNKKIIFDYTIYTLCNNNYTTTSLLESNVHDKTHRFLNQHIIIDIIV